MATRLYLRALTPDNDPGELERSVVLPAHAVSQDFEFAVQSLSTTIGTSEVARSHSSVNTTAAQDNFFTSFSSDALDEQTITAETWTIAVQTDEGNVQANSFTVLSIYVFREPSTIVGFVYDSDTPLGSEWSTNGAGRLGTFSGSAVEAQANDYLVLEFWRHTAGQAMAMSFPQELQYDGSVDVTEGAGGSAGSYLETPQNIGFGGAALAIPPRNLAALQAAKRTGHF